MWKKVGTAKVERNCECERETDVDHREVWKHNPKILFMSVHKSQFFLFFFSFLDMRVGQIYFISICFSFVFVNLIRHCQIRFKLSTCTISIYKQIYVFSV